MSQRLDAVLDRFEAEFGESPSWLDGHLDRIPYRPYVPDYDGARKMDAIRAKQKELGWGWVRVSENSFDLSIKLAPVRPDAVSRRVMFEVMALYRLRPADRFKRRESYSSVAT